MRKVYGTIAALAMAMSLIGMAWASQSVETDAAVSADAATAADVAASEDNASANGEAHGSPELDLSGSSELQADDGNASTELDGEAKTTTSVTVDAEGSTTSTTIDTTSTTSADDDDTTSTTVHDDDTTSTTVDDNDSEGTLSAVVGLKTYQVANVGEVTIDVLAGSLTLVSVHAPGWEVEIEKVTSDRIEIEFHNGEARAEFEAELQSNGMISIETRSR